MKVLVGTLVAAIALCTVPAMAGDGDQSMADWIGSRFCAAGFGQATKSRLSIQMGKPTIFVKSKRRGHRANGLRGTKN